MLRRTLSQNFLRETGAAEFVDLVPDGTGSLVLEVGAGEGVITTRLAGRYDQVVAYEVDPRVARTLAARVGRLGNVRVVVGDFLTAAEPDQPFQVVGNVPFSRTSSIVDWCLATRNMTSTTIITQLEYAKKRTGGYQRWSLLTVLTWPDFDWELRGRISRTQFRPVPRVDAGVLHLARRPAPLVLPSRFAAYRRMVELGFTGVGGTLYASLCRSYPARQLADAFGAARLAQGIVVAFVSPEQWLRLFEALESRPPGGSRADSRPGTRRSRSR